MLQHTQLKTIFIFMCKSLLNFKNHWACTLFETHNCLCLADRTSVLLVFKVCFLFSLLPRQNLVAFSPRQQFLLLLAFLPER